MSSILKKTATHTFGYLFFSVISKLVGIISFPIVTRLLTVGDYGDLALLNTTLLLLYALGKCGIPNALIALNPEQSLPDDNNFYCNAIIGITATTLFVAFLYFCSVYILSYFYVLSEST